MAKDDILIEEQLEAIELTQGSVPLTLPRNVTAIFPALDYRNYQLYFAGQGISLIGFWLHQVALGWLVYQVTQSSFWVGAVAAIGGLPFLVLTTFAGVFVDRVDKQKLLIWTQSLEMVSALLLGILVLTGAVSLPWILLSALITGVVGAVDVPARMAFISEMVHRKDMASAISLNIGVFNTARFIGPALAGVMVAGVGAGWAFVLNGLSFLPATWAMLNIRPLNTPKAEVDTHPLESLKEGLKFSFTHPKLLYLIILGTMMGIFLWPYQTLMPVIAEKVFHSGAGGLGSLLSAAGLGSLLGAFATSAFIRKDNKTKLVYGGLLLSAVALVLLSFNTNYFLAHVLLLLAGFGTVTLASSLNTLVQITTPDEKRGRVLAVYLTAFVGMMPVGNALSGWVAEHTSSLFALMVNGLVVLLVGLVYYLMKIDFRVEAGQH